MAFKLIESAQRRWRAVNAPHLVALVRAGARFEQGKLVEDPKTRSAPNQEVISRPRDPVPEGQDPLSEIVEVGEVAAGDGLAPGRYRAELPEDPEPFRLAELECEHARAALL